MRVIQCVNSVYPQTIGGIETHVYHLSKYLAERGHHVKIITKKGVFEITREGKLKFSNVGIINYLLHANYDLIHMHGWGSLGLGIPFNELTLIISKLKRKSVVCTPHGFVDVLFSLVRNKKCSFSIHRARALFYSALVKSFSFRKIDKFVATYPNQRLLIRFFGADSKAIYHVPPGVPEDAYAKVDPTPFLKKYGLFDRKILGYMGRLDPHKRLADLIYAVQRIRREFRDIICLIIGPYAGDEQNLRRIIQEFNLKEHVIMTGEIDESEKYMALGAIDIFVSPSSHEVFGIALCEAMAQGKPVISANNQGARFLLADGKYGLLYPIGDIEQLVKQIRHLLLNLEFATKMGNMARRRAEEFSWRKIIQKFEEIYLSACE